MYGERLELCANNFPFTWLGKALYSQASLAKCKRLVWFFFSCFSVVKFPFAHICWKSTTFCTFLGGDLDYTFKLMFLYFDRLSGEFCDKDNKSVEMLWDTESVGSTSQSWTLLLSSYVQGTMLAASEKTKLSQKETLPQGVEKNVWGKMIKPQSINKILQCSKEYDTMLKCFSLGEEPETPFIPLYEVYLASSFTLSHISWLYNLH